MLFYCFVLALLVSIGKNEAINCNHTVLSNSFTNIYVLRGKDLEFNNVTISLPDSCNIASDTEQYVLMTCPGSSIFGDATTVPIPPDLTSESYFEHFVGFKRNERETGQSQFVQFDIQPPESIITAIELSFLNSPTNRISLPDISLSTNRLNNQPGLYTNGDMAIISELRNNQNLSQTDHRIRTVALQLLLTPIDSIVNIQLKFNFRNTHDFDWLFLNEVRFCKDLQQEIDRQREVEFQTPLVSSSIVQPSAIDLRRGWIELVCSVSSEGEYKWSWKRNDTEINRDDNSHQITVGDGSRTTKLTINSLTFNNVTTYQCICTLAQGSYSAMYILRYPESVVASPSSKGYLQTREVVLSCELHGYQSSLTPPVWCDRNGSEIIPSPKYTLFTFDGSHSIILENGTTVPSIILSVIIHNISNADEGNYTCRGVREESVTQLTIVEGTQGTIPTSFSTEVPITTEVIIMQTLNDDSTVVIVAVSIVMVVIVLTSIGILITILVLVAKLKNTSSNTHYCEKQYVEVELQSQMEHNLSLEIRNSLIPPIPPQNFDEADLEELGFKYENSELEEESFCQQINEKALANETSVKIVTVNFNGVLEDNPIYDSQPSFEGWSSEDNSLHNYDIQSCEIDDIHDGLEPNPIYDSMPIAIDDIHSCEIDDTHDGLESNPMYDSTPIAIGGNPLYDGIRSNNNHLGNKEEPFYYHELHSYESTEKLNAEFQEDQYKSTLPYEPIYENPSSVVLKSFQIQPENVHEVSFLGVGQFGEVMLAETVGLSEKDLTLGNNTNKNARFLVAVKKLKDKADNTVKESFEKEIRFMSGLSDENIVRLLGECNKEPKFIVIEYMENGDLYQFLNQHELALTTGMQKNQLPVIVLLYMSVQIASGMKYLASLKYVHRDLASRNCLVGQNFTVKISDFGMSRNLYESVYYRVRGRAMLPIRWMATESFYGMFSEKTDIWSFGVTMWEIFTLGRFPPYVELDDQQVIEEAVRKNKRTLLSKPEACPKEVYSVMLKCWDQELDDRANFSEVHKYLNDIYQNLK